MKPLAFLHLAALLLAPLAALSAADSAAPPGGGDWFLLTSHVNEREGLHLAVSPDGLKWQAVNGDKPFFKRSRRRPVHDWHMFPALLLFRTVCGEQDGHGKNGGN